MQVVSFEDEAWGVSYARDGFSLEVSLALVVLWMWTSLQVVQMPQLSPWRSRVDCSGCLNR